MNEKGNRIVSLAAAFLAGVFVAAIAAFVLIRQQSSALQQQSQADQAAETVQQAEQESPVPRSRRDPQSRDQISRRAAPMRATLMRAETLITQRSSRPGILTAHR